MYLSLADPLFGRLNYLSSLGEAIQSLNRLTEPGVSFRGIVSTWGYTSGSTMYLQPLRDQRESFLCLPECSQRRSTERYCRTQR